MADPSNVIGAAASVASIVELLGKTISGLHTLHSRWKEADFTFSNLISQLTTLKVALNNLQEWMDADIDEPHHQLVMDLEASVTYCRMLVRRIDTEVEDLQHNIGMGLDTQKKIKFLLKNGSLEQLQKMVDRQTSALTLLLTICNCKAFSEQKIMLEKKSSRKIFKRVKDDTSLLYVQRDSSSIYSRCTDNLSKIYKNFEFDGESFISKVYEKALRGFSKDIVEKLHREQPQLRGKVTSEEIKRNKLVERELKEHAIKLSKECNILLFGDMNCGQTFITSMRILYSGGFTSEEREDYREAVMSNIMHVMSVTDRILEIGDIHLDESAKMHAKVLSQEIEKIQAGNGKITIEGVGAVQGLLENEEFVRRLLTEVRDLAHLHSPSYFVEEFQRIAQHNYLPTDADILKLGSASPRKGGIQDHTFEMGSFSLHIFDISNLRGERRKWIHRFENITNIMYCVDISQYDRRINEDSNETTLTESLALFESVINSRWFSRAPVILLLCNIGYFKEKLRSKPLGNYFPDYSGGSDFNKASKYLLWRFNQINRSRLNIYPHLCEPSDTSNVRLVWSVVQDTVLQNCLQMCN